MSSFNMDNQMLRSLMTHLQIRPPTTASSSSFLSQTLENLLFDAANLSDENKTELAKEESKLERDLISIIRTGTTNSLKPNSGQAITVGEHHICVGFHEEVGYRIWEWHGHIMQFDEDSGDMQVIDEKSSNEGKVWQSLPLENFDKRY